MRLLLACFVLALLCATTIFAAPYAAIVINADTGEVLHGENADTRLHPAGLTKLITLYAAFDAIETGMVALDESVEISLKAQHEPPVKLGLREGQKIKHIPTMTVVSEPWCIAAIEIAILQTEIQMVKVYPL